MLALLACAAGPTSRRAGSPTQRTPPRSTPGLLVPAWNESVSISSPPAPLIVPGQSPPTDTLARSPRRFAEEQLALGRDLERGGSIGTAYLAYANAVNADSLLPGANAALAHLFLHDGDATHAEPLLRRELRHNPDDLDAARDLGLALSALGRHDEAIARLRKLTQRQPDRDDNWYALGVAYGHAGRKSDAESPLRKAIALPPERALEHRDLGVLLAALNRPREARQEYARALALDPKDATIWLDLGNLETRANRPDSALAAYRAALERDSTLDLAYEGSLKALTTLGRKDEIADLFVRWLTVKPKDDELRMRAVRQLAAIDRRDRALEIGRDGVRDDPRLPSRHLILGLSLAAYGSTREAVAELRVAESLYHKPADRDKVRRLIASMRQSAPDSLREMFRADSAAHAARR